MEAGTSPAPKLDQKTVFQEIPINGSEESMYRPYINVITKHDLLGDKFKMVNTSAHFDKDTSSRHKIKPHPSVYLADHILGDRISRFGELELHSELKPSHDQDAFQDPPEGQDLSRWDLRNRSDAGTKARGQLYHYASEWQIRQHRNHAFTIFLFGEFVRFIRWDRAGAIASQRFDYQKDATHLIDFLWRFSQLSDAARGKDVYVRRATEEEADMARIELKEWEPGPKVQRPLIVFKIPVENGLDREFIAWHCLDEPDVLTGRCTRGYPVYEAATSKKYFLKDGWRVHSLEPEADILRLLEKNKVEHVPTYICGGDVPNGVTQTDIFVTCEQHKEDSDERSHSPITPLPSECDSDSSQCDSVAWKYEKESA
ncbi:hypothetical protein C0991_011636, partial [Blastosporella zonata]